MNKMQAKEFLPMIKALADGKIIQVKDNYDEWKDLKAPSFCEEVCNYRIKPESKLVPFTFEDNLLFRDKWIRQKDLKALSRLSWFGPISISLGDNNKMTYIQLLDNFEFEDGSPCGKYTNE